MNETPKISVIVPVYKVELYLRQCLDSIIAQTYNNLEIILVDDGSPDACGFICDEYAKKDDRIIVIHKENGGLSDARNIGIDIASGEYLTFIDSDDWIELDMVEFLYDNLENNKADISCCNYYLAYMNSTMVLNNYNEIILFEKQEAVKEIFFNKRIHTFFWGKLYKKNIFNYLRLPKSKHYEDIFIMLDILLKTNKIVVCNVVKYYYRQRKSSIVHRNYTPKMLDLIEAAERNLSIIEENYPNIVEFGNAGLLKAVLIVLCTMIGTVNYKQLPEYKNLLSKIRNNYIFMVKNNVFSRSEKIKVISLKINVKLYKFLQSFNDLMKNNILYN